MPDPIRDTREIEPLAGIGGYLEFKWPGAAHTGHREAQRLEVRRWEIQRKFTNADLPMSGGHGSIQHRRVADDFRFTALLDLDLTPIRNLPDNTDPEPGPVLQPHVDGRLEGSTDDDFLISLHFQCGDPTFHSHPDHQSIARPHATPNKLGVYYFCEEVLLGEVVIVNAVGGVVTYRVTGVGSAPLRRYVDDRWCGAGALGISQSIQGGADAF